MLSAFLMMSLIGSCATSSDSFCQTYQPIVRQKGDGAITATRGVKERILANEKTYRGLCGEMK